MTVAEANNITLSSGGYDNNNNITDTGSGGEPLLCSVPADYLLAMGELDKHCMIPGL